MRPAATYSSHLLCRQKPGTHPPGTYRNRQQTPAFRTATFINITLVVAIDSSIRVATLKVNAQKGHLPIRCRHDLVFPPLRRSRCLGRPWRILLSRIVIWITTSIKIGLIHDLISTKSNLTKWQRRKDTKQQGNDVRPICRGTGSITITLCHSTSNRTQRHE